MIFDDLETYLQAQRLVDGYQLYVDGFREQHNKAICIYQYGSDNGPAPIVSNTRQLQFVVRDEDPAAAITKADTLYKHFAQTNNEKVDLTSDRWATFFVRGNPLKLKEDEEGRSYYFFNLGCTTNKF